MKDRLITVDSNNIYGYNVRVKIPELSFLDKIHEENRIADRVNQIIKGFKIMQNRDDNK